MTKSIRADLSWVLSDEQGSIDLIPVLALLAGIEKHGSVRSAAEACGLSYRHAWGTLRTIEQRLGVPLATLERGRGAFLSDAGRLLLRSAEATREQATAILTESADRLTRELAPRPSNAPFRIAASHSFGIVHLRDTIDRGQPDLIELHHYGSRESLRRYANGECDAAGFHVSLTSAGNNIATQLLDLLHGATDRLLILEHRVQGLLSRSDRPCSGLEQLTHGKLRFVNRQPGSGTRLLFDALLEAQGIDPHEVAGYEHEEHTHLAVASLIAGKVADAGLGVHTAAERFGLRFTPLVPETYVLVLKESALAGGPGRALRAALCGDDYRRQFSADPPVDLPIGTVLRTAELRRILRNVS